jgi:hypothetical protein
LWTVPMPSCDHCGTTTPGDEDGCGDRVWHWCAECRVALYCSRGCEVAAHRAGEHSWGVCKRLREWACGRYGVE